MYRPRQSPRNIRTEVPHGKRAPGRHRGDRLLRGIGKGGFRSCSQSSLPRPADLTSTWSVRASGSRLRSRQAFLVETFLIFSLNFHAFSTVSSSFSRFFKQHASGTGGRLSFPLAFSLRSGRKRRARGRFFFGGPVDPVSSHRFFGGRRCRR